LDITFYFTYYHLLPILRKKRLSLTPMYPGHITLIFLKIISSESSLSDDKEPPICYKGILPKFSAGTGLGYTLSCGFLATARLSCSLISHRCQQQNQDISELFTSWPGSVFFTAKEQSPRPPSPYCQINTALWSSCSPSQFSVNQKQSVTMTVISSPACYFTIST